MYNINRHTIRDYSNMTCLEWNAYRLSFEYHIIIAKHKVTSIFTWHYSVMYVHVCTLLKTKHYMMMSMLQLLQHSDIKNMNNKNK